MLTTLQKWLVIATAGLVLLAGAAGAGYWYGVSSTKLKQERQINSDYRGLVSAAFEVMDEFQRIGLELATKLAETKTETKVIYKKQIEYVNLNPLPAVCVPDPQLIELRNAQIERLYRAAGIQLPEERVSGTEVTAEDSAKTR